jgi:hypothetical protein
MTKKEGSFPPEMVSDILSYNKNSGELTWLPRDGNSWFNGQYAGRAAFNRKNSAGYLVGQIKGSHFKAHRVAWCLHYGEWPDGFIDHINGIRDDNRIENLRSVDHSTNCRNRGMYSTNTSGFTGVSFDKRSGKWRAGYRKNNRYHELGYYNCPTAAAVAVAKARSEAGFACDHGKNRT